MSAQKLMMFLVVVAAAVLSTQVSSIPQGGKYAANISHNLIVGYRLPGDRLVLSQNIVKKSVWMQIVTEERTFNVSKWERITLVRALDQKTNGNGAYASITNGGPGSNNVTIRLKSQRGHGINFNVELYARY
ncbi:putative salivary secreted peptide [Habropoda laboriosa]|uniref:Putative salivary secreted peptide n=1 Tax=Habropoda laboriosa TaxID=597456 RepID=A0A0L7R9R9_9HYME|nr:PREDICTED: probable salivary secreted peptide [Habropoda laboriosa]KOC67501.1 putative salivary secreted peptide [Habropoda laboriosa]